MVSSDVSELWFVGNNSTSTSYAIPAGMTYQSTSHIKASTIAAGTGTVTIVAGVCTFTDAQTSLKVGSHLRISGTTYKIDSRTSSTVFSITDYSVSVASSAFHLPDSATALTSGSTFTLAGVSGAATVTTNPAIATTALLRIYREVPYQQLTELATTGQLDPGAIEDALDLATQQIQQIATALANAGIVVPAGATTASDTTSFSNTAARTAATPTRLYQFGVQVDTGNVYYGSSLTAGGWTLTTKGVTQYHASSVAGLTPEYVGQLAVIGAGGDSDSNDKGYTILYGHATTLGSWYSLLTQRAAFTWQFKGWDDSEPLVAGQRRWVGNIPMFIDGITEAFISCDTTGTANAVVKVHFPDTGKLLTTASISLTPALCGSALLDSELSAEALDSQLQRARIEVEIVSTGTAINVTAVEGSAVTTPAGGDLGTVPVGTRISTPDHGDNFVVFQRGDGTVVHSHPLGTTGTAAITAGSRVFVRGIVIAEAGGVTTIPALAADTALIRVGDLVVGPTVPPNTFVATVGATSFAINNPLTGATTLVTVVNETRPPVFHFRAGGISEAVGQTSIQLGTAVTTGIRVGDSVTGLQIPAGTYLTVVNANDFTLSAAIGAGVTIDEFTVTPPVRVATVTAGDFTASLANTVGLLVGSKVTGPGVSEDTYITSIASPVITVNNELTLALAGAATDLFTITRDTIQVTGTTALASTSMTLPYAVNTTPIVAGMVISGPGVQAGTLVSSVAGSVVTMDRAPLVAATSQSFKFEASPSVWAGLILTINGYLGKMSLVSATL